MRGMRWTLTILVWWVCVCGPVWGASPKASPQDLSASWRKVLALIPGVNKEIDRLLKEVQDLTEKGETDKAIKMLRLATQTAAYHPFPHAYLARLYFQLGRDQDAFRVLEGASRSSTNMDLVFELLAQVHLPRRDPPLPEGRVFIASFKDNKRAAISFSFDDGAKEVYTRVLPLFEQFGFVATIPVNPAVISDEPSNPWWGSWREWRDAYRRGFEIANHAMVHRDLTQDTDPQMEQDINGAYDRIAAKIGRAPTSFAFPLDRADRRLLGKALERHLAVRQPDLLRQTYPRVFVPVYGGAYFSLATANQIVEIALRKRLWVIAEAHSVVTKDIKTYKPVTMDLLRGHLAYIKEREDRIWVDTVSGVYQYLWQRRGTKLRWRQLEQRRLQLSLSSSLPPKTPLTVVVRMDEPSERARAFFADEKRRLPVRLQGNNILFDLLPDGRIVEVAW